MTATPPHVSSSLGALRETIVKYDLADLLAAVGGLQLLPENAEREVRLDRLARLAASCTHELGRPQLSVHRLKQLCNDPPVADVAHLEDPADNVFTESLTFFGGSYLVMPGITDDATYIMSQMLKAIFVVDADFCESDFAKRANGLIQAALSLGNEVARRAGLQRGQAAQDPVKGVKVPQQARLSELKAAVTFTDDELRSLLKSVRLTPDVLAPLCTDCGSLHEDEIDRHVSMLSVQPFVRCVGVLVVAEPTSILFALRHQLIRLAADLGVAETLAELYCDAVWNDVVRSLDFIGNQPVAVKIPTIEGKPCYRQGFFRLDTDKLLYTAVVTDSFQDYGDDPHGEWKSEGLSETFVGALEEAACQVLSSGVQVNDVLGLFVVQPAGRWFGMGLADPTSPLHITRTVLSGADLKIIAELEGGDQLLLWNYAKAAERVRETTAFGPVSRLDEFYLYRARGFSYHVSDDAPPTLLSIMPGSACVIRQEAQDERDWHAVKHYLPGQMAEVTTLHGDRRVPLYVDPARFRRRFAVYVESLPIPLWVVAGEAKAQEVRVMQPHFCEMLAFWIWQLSDGMRSELEELRVLDKPLVLRVLLEEDEPAWTSNELAAPESVSVQDAVEFEVDGRGSRVDIIFKPIVKSLFSGPTNYGERLVMIEVLKAIRSLVRLVNTSVANELTDQRITELIEERAPLGMKKMFIVSDVRFNPALDDSDVPPYRHVSKATVSDLQDEIAYSLRQQGVSAGPAHNGNKMLNDIVANLYAQLERLVHTVRRDVLLEHLVAMNEALLAHGAQRDLTIPTRAACYGEFFDIVEQVMEEQTAANSAALASRFAIEYVAVRPSDGTRPMSLAVYDRLQALAEQIVNWGFTSDVMQLKIAPVDVTVTESGRVRVVMDGYAEGKEAYMKQALFPAQVRQAVMSFERQARSNPSASEKPPEAEDLDEAAKAEFGMPLSDILGLLVEVENVGYRLDGPVKVMLADELVTALSTSLSWDEERVRQGVQLVSLKPREAFLSPPQPFSKTDVYPWRFNRELSYVRRPLIWRERDQGWEIVWGNRHVHLAGQNLLSLCASGRLKARTHEMKSFISKSRGRVAEAFNDDVADAFDSIENNVVRRRVWKIAGERIGGRATPFGDIDVLVADTSKQEILCVECKDLALARTPHELANEIEHLFVGKSGEESVAARHLKRCKWVQEHIKPLLQDLGIGAGGKWSVRPLLVLDDEPLSAWIKNSPMEVMGFVELRRQLVAAEAETAS